ncbi:MAG TPA: tripartite tricarboxylate transporter substrate binding protein [Burkholderiaceae bacterium]|nr:tripartite tricarboxylate transporter substrate binding protein [Burkholderiaceae bacterium]
MRDRWRLPARTLSAHGLACMLAAMAMAVPAAAQETWPARPIKFVVPSPPGSTTDLTARAIGQRISGPLGQPVVIENRPGAAGQIGMQQVARSPADGYTYVVVSASTTVVPPAVTKTLPYVVTRDFAPVSLIASTRLMMVVAKESPWNSVADVVAAAKAAPGKITYGDSASLYLLSMERFKQLAGIDLVGVKYKGPADAANDLIGGRLGVTPDSLGSVSGHLQSGRVKPLAVFSAERLPGLPQVPTMIELGYQDFEFDGWIGLLAPAGTPPAIVRRLADEIATAIRSDEIRQQYAGWMLDPVSMAPDRFTAMIARETERFEAIARRAGIEKQ